MKNNRVTAGGDGGHQLQIAVRSLEKVDWQDQHILDIGSSRGNVTFEILKYARARKITGIEIDENRVNDSRLLEKKYPEQLEFFVGDAHDLSRFADNYFDGIFSNMVFQQIKENIEPVFSEVFRVLKPAKLAIINFNQEKSDVTKAIQELTLGKAMSSKKALDENTFRNYAEKAGFRVESIKSEYSIYYHKNIDKLIGDPSKASMAVRDKSLTDDEAKAIWKKLREKFETTKTLEGYPERWNIVYARLRK